MPLIAITTVNSRPRPTQVNTNRVMWRRTSRTARFMTSPCRGYPRSDAHPGRERRRFDRGVEDDEVREGEAARNVDPSTFVANAGHDPSQGQSSIADQPDRGALRPTHQ